MSSYPVRVNARLDEPLSRWLWLVKWLLVIPHYIVLFFLWIAYVVLTAVAFFAILFTGRYPRAIFDFNVGVLRWAWRVSYYSYSGLATDRYPPFTLAEEPDYPATLQVDYPERLSRGLVLVKWWLLAIPHYLVLAVFIGAGYGYTADDNNVQYTLPTLLGLLVFVAGVVLLFTGRYPHGIYNLAMGVNRWALRVAAYASLMTDEYPPFRLDQGGEDPAGPGTPPPGTPAGTAAWPEPAPAGVSAGAPAPGGGAPSKPPMGGPGAARAPMAGAPTAGGPASDAPGTAPPGTPGGPPPGTPGGPPPGVPGGGATAGGAAGGWTAGRVVAVVLSALLVAIGLGVATGGGVLAWANGTQRDAAGFLSTPTQRYTTPSGYGLRFDALEIQSWPRNADLGSWLGTVRVQAQDRQGGSVFIGIADSSDVTAYCGGTAMMQDYWDGDRRMPGMVVTAPPRTAPADQPFWVASASGTGTQTLTWEPTDGTWTLVVMNAEAGRGFDVDVTAGAKVPVLRPLGIGLLIGGGLAVLVGAVLIVVVAASTTTRQRARAG